jgi:hypothetical protein
MPLPEPAVSRRALVLTAAVLWTVAGGVLVTRASLWLIGSGVWGILIATVSIAVGMFKGWFVFVRIARKNDKRITELSPNKDKICVFAFQAMQSYLVVFAMITLGLLLRLSPIPRLWLAAIYLAIGSALLFSSLVYWKAAKETSIRP